MNIVNSGFPHGVEKWGMRRSVNYAIIFMEKLLTKRKRYATMVATSGNRDVCSLELSGRWFQEGGNNKFLVGI